MVVRKNSRAIRILYWIMDELESIDMKKWTIHTGNRLLPSCLKWPVAAALFAGIFQLLLVSVSGEIANGDRMAHLEMAFRKNASPLENIVTLGTIRATRDGIFSERMDLQEMFHFCLPGLDRPLEGFFLNEKGNRPGSPAILLRPGSRIQVPFGVILPPGWDDRSAIQKKEIKIYTVGSRKRFRCPGSERPIITVKLTPVSSSP